MYKQYFKQALFLIKENKLLSIISILGTALAISIIMVIIILIRAKTADYAPESHRSRMLYVKWGSAVEKKNEDNRNVARLSLYDIREAFYPLTSTEAVTATYPYGPTLLSIMGSEEEDNAYLMYTDAAFWKVYEFDFVAGKPYDQVSFEAGLKQIILCETVARTLFGEVNESIGKPVNLNFVEFTVVGVVKDVSKFAELSYAEAWAPYTSNSEISRINTIGWGGGHTGEFICHILARSSSDFTQIREELAILIAKMNANSPEFYLDIKEQPNTFFIQMIRKFGNTGPDMSIVYHYIAIILVVLLVPAINLSGLTYSRMQKRITEIGIRKAFGAPRSSIISQLLWENFLLTIMGGIVGIIFSYLSIGLMSGWLLAVDDNGVAAMNASMISPWIFFVALAFCLILNLLSVGIPAWRATRVNVVNALNNK